MKSAREFAENICAGGFREPLVDVIERLATARDAEHAADRASAVKSAVAEAVRNAAEKLREDAQEMDRLDAELSSVTAERDALLADRASRGTEREVGRDGHSPACIGLDGHGPNTRCPGGPAPSSGEMVRREDVVRWLRTGEPGK